MTHVDATTITYESLYGTPRRVRFEPCDDGRYRRVELVWNGCRWRQTGSELVESMRIVDPESPQSV